MTDQTIIPNTAVSDQDRPAYTDAEFYALTTEGRMAWAGAQAEPAWIARPPVGPCPSWCKSAERGHDWDSVDTGPEYVRTHETVGERFETTPAVSPGRTIVVDISTVETLRGVVRTFSPPVMTTHGKVEDFESVDDVTAFADVLLRVGDQFRVITAAQVEL